MIEKKILQVDGKPILPITHETAVVDDNGVSLPEKYATKEDIPDTTSFVKNYEIGELSHLETINKSTLVEAINELFRFGNNVKKQLVDALIAKGLNCSTDDSWEYLRSQILANFRYDNSDDSGGGSGDDVYYQHLVLVQDGIMYNDEITGGVDGYNVGYYAGQGINVSFDSSTRHSIPLFANEIDITNYNTLSINFYSNKIFSEQSGQIELLMTTDEGSVTHYLTSLPITTSNNLFNVSLEGINGYVEIKLVSNTAEIFNFFIDRLILFEESYIPLLINNKEGDEINE